MAATNLLSQPATLTHVVHNESVRMGSSLLRTDGDDDECSGIRGIIGSVRDAVCVNCTIGGRYSSRMHGVARDPMEGGAPVQLAEHVHFDDVGKRRLLRDNNDWSSLVSHDGGGHSCCLVLACSSLGGDCAWRAVAA